MFNCAGVTLCLIVQNILSATVFAGVTLCLIDKKAGLIDLCLIFGGESPPGVK